MASLIEQLMGNPLARPDKALPIPERVLPPERPRDLFGILANFGPYTSTQTLKTNVDWKLANPHMVMFSALGRMPSAAELDALMQPYVAHVHLRQLLGSQEFRLPITQRLLETHADRQRHLWVRLPGCGHEAMLDVLAQRHPMVPDVPAGPRIGGEPYDAMLIALGVFMAALRGSRTVMAVGPSLLELTRPAAMALDQPGLGWVMRAAPLRVGDTISTLLADPVSVALARLRALVAAVLAPAPLPKYAALRKKLALADDADENAVLAHAAQLIGPLLSANPICSALGDGTAEGTVALCREADIELADTAGMDGWITARWDMDAPEPPAHQPAPLALDRLAPPAQAALLAGIEQDQRFYEIFKTRLALAGWVAVKGTALV